MKPTISRWMILTALTLANTGSMPAQGQEVVRPHSPQEALCIVQTTIDKMRFSGLYSGAELASILEPLLEHVNTAKIVVETEFSLATEESVRALRSVIDSFCTVQKRIKSDQLKTAYAPYAEQILVGVYTLRRQIDYKGSCGSIFSRVPVISPAEEVSTDKSP